MDTIHGSYRRSERKPRQPVWCTGAALVTGLTALCMGLAGMTSSADAFDIAVGEIIVTQGIQHNDPLFWVPLVAERSTAVRVHITCLNGNPSQVTGKLKVFVDGQEVTPLGGVDDINHQFPNANGQFSPTCGRFIDVLDFEEDMLTFELPAPNGLAPSGNQLQSNNVYFEVEIFANGDTDTSNNSLPPRPPTYASRCSAGNSTPSWSTESLAWTANAEYGWGPRYGATRGTQRHLLKLSRQTW